MELKGKLFVRSHPKISVFLVQPENDPQTDPFQQVKAVVLSEAQVRRQVQYFLDEDHQTVNVKHYHLRHIEHDCSVQQLKDADQYVGSLRVKVLEELRREA